MKNTIEQIEFKSKDLDYSIKFHLKDSNGRKRGPIIVSGQYANDTEKENFETHAHWKDHFISWVLQPEKKIEDLKLKIAYKPETNITDYYHLITKSGEAISTFSFVGYMLKNLKISEE